MSSRAEPLTFAIRMIKEVALYQLTLPLAFALWCSTAHAQTHGVVAGLDTRLPLRDAKVSTDLGMSATTNYLGQFSLAGSFRSASISCKGYLTRRLNADEFHTDTLFLIPLAVKLRGVEIVAPKATRDVKQWMRSTAATVVQKNNGMAFDMFSMFDHRVRKVSEAERKKQKRVLDNY